MNAGLDGRDNAFTLDYNRDYHDLWYTTASV